MTAKETLADLLRDGADGTSFRIAAQFVEDAGPGTHYDGELIDKARDRILAYGLRYDLLLVMAAFAIDCRDGLAEQRDGESLIEYRARLLDDARVWLTT